MFFNKKKELSEEEMRSVMQSQEYKDLIRQGIDTKEAIEILSKKSSASGIEEKNYPKPDTYFQGKQKQEAKKYWK